MKVADLLKSFHLVAPAHEHLLPGAQPVWAPDQVRIFIAAPSVGALLSLRSILHTWLSHLIGFFSSSLFLAVYTFHIFI